MADLAIKSDDVRLPYESKGVKAMVSPIELEKGSSKGTLHYTAEFIPSLALKIAEFEKQTTEKDRVASEYNERSSIGSEDDLPSDATYQPERTPTPTPNAQPVPATNNVPAADVKTNGAGEPNGAADKKAETEVVELSHEELLAQRECCLYVILVLVPILL